MTDCWRSFTFTLTKGLFSITIAVLSLESFFVSWLFTVQLSHTIHVQLASYASTSSMTSNRMCATFPQHTQPRLRFSPQITSFANRTQENKPSSYPNFSQEVWDKINAFLFPSSALNAASVSNFESCAYDRVWNAVFKTKVDYRATVRKTRTWLKFDCCWLPCLSLQRFSLEKLHPKGVSQKLRVIWLWACYSFLTTWSTSAKRPINRVCVSFYKPTKAHTCHGAFCLGSILRYSYI